MLLSSGSTGMKQTFSFHLIHGYRKSMKRKTCQAVNLPVDGEADDANFVSVED